MSVGYQRPDFAEFYRSSKDECLRTVLSCVGDLDAAQDLVDEAFARACASWRKVSRHPAPAAWVVRTALNVNISRWRRRRREVAVPDFAAGRGPARWLEASDSPIDPAIMAALLSCPRPGSGRSLPCGCARLDTGGTAEILGISPSTVMAHMTHALAALRTDHGRYREQETSS